jgi:hypothetical protein
MYLKEMGYESVDWIHLSQHTDEWRAFMNMEMELRGSVQSGNVSSGCETPTFSRMTLLTLG